MSKVFRHLAGRLILKYCERKLEIRSRTGFPTSGRIHKNRPVFNSQRGRYIVFVDRSRTESLRNGYLIVAGELTDGMQPDVGFEGRRDPPADFHSLRQLDPLLTSGHTAVQRWL